MTLRWPRFLAYFLLALLVLTLFAWFVLLRPVAQPRVNDPIQAFNHGSIGNEQAQGLPYWIWRVLPQMFPDHLPGNQDGYGAFGVFWKAGEELPVGFSKKTLGVIPRVSPNCAFCHQGSYRLTADSGSILVPGGPGTRVRVQDFLRFLAKVGQDARFTPSNVLDQIEAIYDMPLWERLLYRFILIPFTKSALEEQAARFAWTDDRPDWGPGRIDPFNPIKFDNLGMGVDETIGNSDMMPLWGLNYEAADVSRDYALHWDGLNTSLRVVVVTGASGDGMSYKSFPLVEERLIGFENWMRLRRPPPSPFASRRPYDDPYYVVPSQVAAGRSIYEAHCADCHQPEGRRFRTVIPAIELGTDRHRLDMWTAEAARRYAAYEEDYRWGFQAFQDKDGYVATEHLGLWLKGPYLHNGSVPTLRDLLKKPEQRPKTFYRGWDLVDTKNGGFISQAGTDAQRYGWYYDTSLPGNSNAGHLYGTDLADYEKEQLLAYLKTL